MVCARGQEDRELDGGAAAVGCRTASLYLPPSPPSPLVLTRRKNLRVRSAA